MSDWEIGVFSSWDEMSEDWLNSGQNRKAIVVGLISENLPLNTFFFPAPTLIHREIALQKVGQLAAFSNAEVFSEELKSSFFQAKLHAEMRLSDVADLGVRNTEHLLKNGKSHLTSLRSIKNSFQGTPAIIIGAGPSLQDHAEILKKCKGKALLIAAGSGLRKSPVEPDLFFASDPHHPMDRCRYPNVPMCVEGRVHPETLKNAPDLIYYVPDSHLPLEGWLMEDEEVFEGGWNAANGAAAVAHLLGCSPIYLAGVDLCYLDGKKYADEEAPSIPLIELEGKRTQHDWLLAVEWFREKEEEYSLLNFSQKGIQVGQFVKDVELTTLCPKFPLGKPVRLRDERLQEWRDALESKNEIARSKLIDPLWDLWSALFERENVDLSIQKQLFSDRVVQEHLKILQEEKVSYYQNGQTKTVERFFGGFREGETLLYWPSGQIKRRVEFLRGKRVGKEEFFDEEGFPIDDL